MHRFTLELRVSSATLDPGNITAEVGLSPTTSWRAGDVVCRGPERDGLWGYAPGGEWRPWTNFEQMLTTLLNDLEPFRSKLKALRGSHQVELWCVHFASGSGAGPSFTPELLQRLAMLGIGLHVETRFVNDAPPNIGCTP